MAEKFIPKQLWCCGCNRQIDAKEFYYNYNSLHEYQRHNYCKSCTKELSNKIFNQYCNKIDKDDSIGYELAIRHICSFFDMPYIEEAMIKMREAQFSGVKDREWNYVFQYGSVLKDLGYNESKYWDNLSGNTLLAVTLFKQDGNNNNAKPNSPFDMELLNGLEKDWNSQDSLHDYLWLEEKFFQYTDGETLTPAMIDTIRYLCLAQLDVKKLRDKKSEQKDITVAEKRVGEYLKQLKLDDFKFNKSKSVGEKMLENWIYTYENIEPVDWEDENLKNRCGFKKDNDDIMRSIGNKVLGTRNFPQLDLDDVKR